MASYNTTQRKMLINFLKSNPDKQFSVREIYNELYDSSISLSAIYRNISALEADGVINRFSKEGSREICYQYTQHENCRNSLHLTCVECGKTFHMNKSAAEEVTKVLKEKDGFILNKLKTVMYGFCSDCAKESLI